MLRTFILSLMLPIAVAAQSTVAPPIAEFSQSKVGDAFELRNESETEPMVVTGITAYTFTVNEQGKPSFLPIDATKISLRVSDNSIRIPPQGRRSVYVEMKCLQAKVCWATLYVSIAQGKNSEGMGVTLALPHTLELGVGSIHKRDIQVKFIDAHSFAITNAGSGLDRPTIEMQTASEKKTFGTLILPNGTRLVTSDSPVSKVTVKFAHFKVVIKQ